MRGYQVRLEQAILEEIRLYQPAAPEPHLGTSVPDGAAEPGTPETYSMERLMSEGRAAEKNLTEKDVDPEQLRMGIEVEYEHTSNPDVAKKICLDHLAELPDYYTRLKEMETG